MSDIKTSTSTIEEKLDELQEELRRLRVLLSSSDLAVTEHAKERIEQLWKAIPKHTLGSSELAEGIVRRLREQGEKARKAATEQQKQKAVDRTVLRVLGVVLRSKFAWTAETEALARKAVEAWAATETPKRGRPRKGNNGRVGKYELARLLLKSVGVEISEAGIRQIEKRKLGK